MSETSASRVATNSPFEEMDRQSKRLREKKNDIIFITRAIVDASDNIQNNFINIDGDLETKRLLNSIKTILDNLGNHLNEVSTLIDASSEDFYKWAQKMKSLSSNIPFMPNGIAKSGVQNILNTDYSERVPLDNTDYN